MEKLFSYYDSDEPEMLLITTENTGSAGCQYMFFDEEGEVTEQGILDDYPEDENDLEDIAIKVLDLYEITADEFKEIDIDEANINYYKGRLEEE